MNVLVCGSGYGAAYAYLLADTAGPFHLSGILARGSDRSSRLAAETGVALYRSVETLPAGIDIACVAVGGQAGHDLTLALLRRRLHVLAEHPVGVEAVRAALTVAGAAGVCYHVNSHFPDLDAPRAFVRACRERAAAGYAPRCLLAVAGPRTLYSTLDVLARALGTIVPFATSPISAWPAHPRGGLAPGALPVRALGAVLAGVPLSLTYLDAVSPRDDGGDMVVGHRLIAVFPDGNLMLVNAWGPVLWSRVPSPALLDDPRPLVETIAANTATFRTYIQQDRADANLRALTRLAGRIRTGVTPPEQQPHHLIAVAGLWQEIQRQLATPPATSVG